MTEQEKQLEIAGRLQTKWLEHMEKLIDNGQITPTDMSTLERFLRNNGWSLDPARLPKGLRDKLTSHVATDEFDDDDIVGSIRKEA